MVGILELTKPMHELGKDISGWGAIEMWSNGCEIAHNVYKRVNPRQVHEHP